jgi:hypothetical protein
VKEQASKIQKVSDEVELKKSTTQTAANKWRGNFASYYFAAGEKLNACTEYSDAA